MTAKVVLGVGGGIAAYKSAELLRLFTESGHDVTVVPTAAALKFVGEPTWSALSGKPVSTEVWDNVADVPHVKLGREADLVVIAPATADLLARGAHGRADDLLTNVLLTARCPVVFAPAMHTEMWEHAATTANVATLRERGAIVLEPAVGRLTGADTGKGRLPEPAEIFAAATRVLHRGQQPPDLTGLHVLITAGGTREFLDPVRYIGNLSSGKQGFAFARTAAARGAQVTVLAANIALPDPAGVTVIPVTTTEQLRQAVHEYRQEADVIVMAAAPCDFRPAHYSDSKLKKVALEPLQLTLNPDIAAEVGAAKAPGQTLIAFAAETHDALENATAKLVTKRADLIVVNDVSAGQVFGADLNTVTVLGDDGTSIDLPQATKDDVADAVWDIAVGFDRRRRR